MDKPDNDAPQDGAKFLEQLDAALDGKIPAGKHSDVAAFGSELKHVLNAREEEMKSTAPEQLRRCLKLSVSERKSKSNVVKLDKKLSRFRLGLLDIAALVGVAVLGFLIWSSLKTPTSVSKKDPEPVPVKKENTFAAENGKKEKPKEPEPMPPPAILPPIETTELAKKLQQTISFEFVETPTAEALEFLRRASKTTIIVDPRAAAAGMGEISLKAKDMTFVSALRWVARLSGTRMSIKDNVIFFSTPGNELLRIEAYDTQNIKLRSMSLVTILQRMPFDPPLGVDNKTSVVGNEGILTLTSTQQVHDQVQQILKQAEEGTNSGIIDFQPHPNWMKVMEKKLERKISFEFVDTKFEDGLAFIQSVTNVPIVADPKVFENGSPHITLRVQEMSAHLALGWILRLADLNFELRDEAVFVFKGDTPPHFVAYKPEHFEKNVKLSLTDMASEIRNRINPKSWDAAQGTSIEEMDGWLIVRQSKDVHRDIQNWLTGKVKAAGQQPQ